MKTYNNLQCIIFLCLVAAACLGSWGCGDDGVMSPADGAASGNDSGVSSSNIGTVAAAQETNSSGSSFETAVLAFFSTSSANGASCTHGSFGPCTTTTCPINSLDAGGGGGVLDAGAIIYPTAGPITMSGAMSFITLTPNPNGRYGFAAGTTKLWNGGEDLTFQAPGSAVPAFNQTIKAPATLANISPELTFPNTLAVSRNSDFVVHWTPLADGINVGVSVTQSSATERNEATCTYSGKDGTGNVPSAALSTFDAASAHVSFHASSETRVTMGSWNLTFRAETRGPGSGAVVFE